MKITCNKSSELNESNDTILKVLLKGGLLSSLTMYFTVECIVRVFIEEKNIILFNIKFESLTK